MWRKVMRKNETRGAYCVFCVYLDPIKKRCAKWGDKLAYVKRTGVMGFIAFEKCKKCWDGEDRKNGRQV
jgi:hypothetical protein